MLWGRFENSALVEISEAKPTSYPPDMVWLELPSKYMDLGFDKFYVENGTVFPDVNSLREFLFSIIEKKKTAFRESATIEYNGNRFYTDSNSSNTLTSAITLGTLVQTQYNAAATKGKPAKQYEIPWKTVDGFVTLNLTDLTMIAITIGQFVTELFVKENDYKEALYAENDPVKIVDIYKSVNFSAETTETTT